MRHAILGGIGLTVLDVYDQRPGPDGVQAGCAHIHAITDEAYFGLSGSGAIDLHDPVQGYRRVAIEPGTFVQFPAGTLHRSVSFERLRVLAIMGNSGLPERGDARIYFGEEVDADPRRYEEARALVSSGLEGGLARRDLSAKAYAHLMWLWENDRSAHTRELNRFLDVHRQSLVSRTQVIAEAIENGPLQQAAMAFRRLSMAPAYEVAERWESTGARVSYGMCGILRQIDDFQPS